MFAELHLAEDAFALHLLLQHLKGLIDIVIADENLHVLFLFDRVKPSDRQVPKPLACGRAGFERPWHPQTAQASI